MSRSSSIQRWIHQEAFLISSYDIYKKRISLLTSVTGKMISRHDSKFVGLFPCSRTLTTPNSFLIEVRPNENMNAVLTDILLRDWQNAFVYDSPNRLLNNHHCCYEYIWHDIGTCIFQIYLRVVATHVSGLTCTRASRWLGHEASTSRVLVITISGPSPVFTNGNHFLVRYLTKMYLLIDEIDR